MTPTGLFEAMNDPQMRHAALVHMPIALAFLGLIPAAIALALPKLGRAPVVVTIIAYALLIGGAWAGVLSGEVAYGEMGPLPAAVQQQAHQHEELAEKIWFFALGVFVLSLGALINKPKITMTCRALALVVGLVCAGWTAYVAHLGGSLVYDFGVGTPRQIAPIDVEPSPPSTGDPTAGPIGDPAIDDLDDQEDPRVSFFLTSVVPILERRCLGCHTPGEKLEGDLDLTSIRGILAGGESGPVLLPGKPDESSLYTSTTGEHPTLRMPKTGRRLTPEQTEALRQWITDGAVWTSLPQ